MVCGACHRAKTEVKESPKRDWFIVTTTLQALLGLALLWAGAWFLGRLIVSTPVEFHEGLIWQRFSP